MIRQLRPGEPVPERQPRRYVASHGYVRLRWRVGPSQYVEVYEHRVDGDRVTVAEQVHHENRNRADNRPENLHPFTVEEHRQEHASPEGDEIVRRYEAGQSIPTIAAALDRDGSAVYRLLARRGVKFRSPTEYARPLRSEDIRRLYESGLRPGHIAKALGVGRVRVERAMDELGLPRYRAGRPRDGFGNHAGITDHTVPDWRDWLRTSDGRGNAA